MVRFNPDEKEVNISVRSQFPPVVRCNGDAVVLGGQCWRLPRAVSTGFDERPGCKKMPDYHFGVRRKAINAIWCSCSLGSLFAFWAAGRRACRPAHFELRGTWWLSAALASRPLAGWLGLQRLMSSISQSSQMPGPDAVSSDLTEK